MIAGLGRGADFGLSAEVPVPVDDRFAEQDEGHRSCREVGPEGDLLLYRRQSDAAAVVIALNLGAEPISIASETIGLDGEILLSTMLDRRCEKIAGELDLRGNEGVIIGPSSPHAG